MTYMFQWCFMLTLYLREFGKRIGTEQQEGKQKVSRAGTDFAAFKWILTYRKTDC